MKIGWKERVLIKAQIVAAAIEYSKLRRERSKLMKYRTAAWKKCENYHETDGPCFAQKIPRDEQCEWCGEARGCSTAEIGSKCGAALNKIHRLVKKLGE